MKKFAFLCVLALSAPAYAQDQSRLDAAQAYVETPVQQKLLDDMFSPAGVMAQLGLTGGQLTLEQQETVAGIVSEELQSMKPSIVNAMVEGMAQSFTLEEIEALTAFYSSPVGASAMSKMTPFMQQTMTSLGPEFQAMQARLIPRIQAELSK
ncbi:DUF2059 domain-containing protein [uncultured Tateyamaria sp.]|uniref:DUF2059 domain-containing protein n=1 Tax=uncultured Tateyamaria sp. TaxID=455651 RepID=UPI0026107A99|nr:DUF2059 domain-containing protein [uncultured Tateyamaria sp.]